MACHLCGARKIPHLFLQVGTQVKMPIAQSTSRSLLTAEERYIKWMNQQLEGSGKYVENLNESLADGILIIHALEVS